MARFCIYQSIALGNLKLSGLTTVLLSEVFFSFFLRINPHGKRKENISNSAYGTVISFLKAKRSC